MLQMGYEHLDMPELIENHIWVELPDSVRDIYNALEKDFITALDNRTVTAANAASMSSKIRQVANGGIFLDPELLASGLRLPKSKREWANLHTSKVDALRDLVDELQGDPVLVAYDFEHDLDRLREKFKDGVFACDFSMKQFSRLEQEWNAGEIPLLFGHPQSIGHGLNLQDAAQHVAWHSLTWNRELYDQFVDRIWRQGNKFKQVFVHHIMAESTIDEAIYMALNSKGKVEQALFDGIKRMATERRER
jgi:SNF2 family DNA or RNA helicase